MRADIIRMYKDIHTWVGIVSGLSLFIAFYAGAITMFEVPVQRWASAPSTLPAAVSLNDAPRLVAATLAGHPEAAKDYAINMRPRPEAPARMTWAAPGASGKRGDEIHFASSLTSEGQLAVARRDATPVAEFIDVLHQQIGLPVAHEIAMPIMGAVSLLYAIALVSGVIVLLPSLAKDLFALRLGRNLKRMWLDVHNALGVFSLPFHIVMALSATVFAFHDQFYDTQNLVLYERRIDEIWKQGRTPTPVVGPGAVMLSPAELAQRIEAQAPGFEITTIGYQTNPKGVTLARVEGSDPRYAMRGPTFGFGVASPYDGTLIETYYMPGLQTGWTALITGLFTLHFGSFGGDTVRWGYFLLGLAGAFLFYSGNLLWIETRRKRMTRKVGEVAQSRSTQVLGALTIGVSLGCISGISLTLAAAKWLPGRVDDLAAWHSGLYYTVFLAAIGWAFLRGAARGATDLLAACALTTALIPLSSLVAAADLVPHAWNHGGSTLLVDLVAILGVVAFLILAAITRRRTRHGAPDSIWSAIKR